MTIPDTEPAPRPPVDATVFTGRGADLLVECLHRHGVRVLFGVPGDTGVVLYDALYDRTRQVRHVLARDERHAVAMADAYARVANVVGAVEVSSGGGTTYAVGGLGEAYASGVPVLLISSDIHSRSRNTGALTEIDQAALFAAVTKWRHRVESADEITAVVPEALRQATSGRPAPVALIFPEDVLDEVVTTTLPAPRPDAVRVPRHRPPADPAAVGEAARLLAAAQRPAILAGSGVHLSGAYRELAALADAAGVPVATSIHGKGAIADDHPWSLGVVGNNGGRPYANDYLAEADVTLLVGVRANATDTNSYTAPPRTSRVIGIDIDPVRAGRTYPGSLKLVGDAATVLAQLTAQLPVPGPEPVRERAGQRRARVERARRDWPALDPPDLAEGVLFPPEVIRVVREVVGPDALVVADPGTPTPNVAAYWDKRTPGRSIVIPRGHGPMGYAIPAAVGIALARPGRPVVAFTADGSFAMACGELETVARLRLPVIVVQFTNHSLGWIKMLQHLYTGRRYFGVDPGTIDAVPVAQACGLSATRVRDLTTLRKLTAAHAEDLTPVYLDIEVPHMIDVVPPVSSWTAALAGDDTRPVY
jgi:acetolactate synthase-1/2/3 large subunit